MSMVNYCFRPTLHRALYAILQMDHVNLYIFDTSDKKWILFFKLSSKVLYCIPVKRTGRFFKSNDDSPSVSLLRDSLINSITVPSVVGSELYIFKRKAIKYT